MEKPDVNCEPGECGAVATRTASPVSSVSGALSDDSSEKTLPSYPFLGSAEDTFIQSGLNLITVSELKQAVEKCKEMVLETKEYSDERKWLVRYLIELRLRLEDAREAEAEHKILEPIGTPDLSPTNDSVVPHDGVVKKTRDKRIILGHHFVLQAPTRNILKCDRCCGNIWGVLHLWYTCSDCQYKCHMKCLEKIKRQCTLVRVSETPFYSNNICPEVGLAAQEYRCYECKTLICQKGGWCEPRRCDYDGRYYCSNCHWDYASIIPARVVHNWDFVERKVCCDCFNFLRLMLDRPVINLDVLNPQLFQFVLDLVAIKKLRSQILLVKQYLIRCPSGLKEKNRKGLVWSLSSQLTENPSVLFSLQDLINIHNNTFIPVLQEAVDISANHIRNCLVCKQKGYYCELCPPRKKHEEEGAEHQKQRRDVILFAFDDDKLVFVCSKCSAVFHRECWMRKTSGACPRCDRLQERQSLLQEPID
ncbi:hypothetical protein ONE63_010124 [Megalurothrips usitatus]|uniref:Phorbol-ester/DAG-type domain-containing protein n=1 Tax=Megalurothrips usitatus TaxID=439358 RepID=A0AAV7XPE3_9NEOP|nr:hypothetical protein ONE63_010124 [Megalurothrips usitatus]